MQFPSSEMRPQIVIFGDSITEQSFRSGGWGASLADNYSRKADVVLRGYGGYNTRWALFLLHHLFPLGSATPPVATTIFFGANDAALFGRTSQRQHVPTEEYKENLRKIVHHLKECSPAMLVVLITPPPIDEEGRFTYARSLYGERAMELPERTNEMTGVYAKQCVELAKELGLPSINLWLKMQETEGWQKKFLSDGLHLTPEGNAVVHQEVVRVFNEAGLSAPEMPYDFPHHSEIDGKAPEKAFQRRLVSGFAEMLRRLLVQVSTQHRRCLFTPHSSFAFRQCSSSSSSSPSQIGNSTFVEHLKGSNQSTEATSQPSSTLSVDRSGLYNPPEHSHEPSSDSELVKHLKGIIKFRGGPISVAEYMEEVLTNPKAGFYINRDVFGAEGDFITSPEVSQMFGEMVGVWAMCLWEQMGQPNRVNLIELGPGRGTLMADLLRGSSKCKNFIESLHIHMVECSPTLQKLQYENLKCVDEDHPEKRSISTLARTPVSWHATLEQVPTGLPTIIIAHEFFDALPVHQFQRASRGWCEKMIDVAEDSSFRFVLSPQPTPATLFLMKRCKWAGAEEIAKLDRIEVSPKSMELTQTIAKRISSDGGGALIIDYGLNGVVSDSLQAIQKHKFVDILDNPGTADLSAYVDFASVMHSAEEVSEDVSVHGPITQSQFLGSLGINFRVEALLENCTDEQAESLRTGYWRLVGDGEAPFWEGPDEQVPIGMGTRYLAMAIVNKKQGIPVPFQ